MVKRKCLTLSLETSEVRLLVIQGQRIARWERLSLPVGAVRNGLVVQPKAFGQTIAKSLKRGDGPRKRAVVSFGGQRTLVRTLSLPPMPSHLLEEAVRREARRELPLPLEDLYLSWHVTSDHGASQLQVLTVGVPREALDSYVFGLRSAGVRPTVMDLKSLALARAVNLPDVLIADVEAETETVVLVRGFVPQIVRSVGLPVSSTRSETERVANIVADIQRILDFYGSVQAGVHASWSPTVCLTGALGGEPEIRALVARNWPLAEPAPPMAIPKELPMLPYLVNIGLALKS
jgi:Tfp pilus assembly PilM family ATPase